MRPKIAVSLPCRTTGLALKMLHKASRLGADFVEIRLDYLNDTEGIERIAENSQLPLIATFRSAEQGGMRKSTTEERERVLRSAAEVGFDYVDLELEARNLVLLIKTFRGMGAKTIVSYHDLQKTPSAPELRKKLHLCQDAGGSVLKLITTARRIQDNLRLLDLVMESCGKSELVCFGMGKTGLISRILSPVFGATFTFASIDEKAVAPGQISISRMRKIYDELGYS
jgi:3-dehydroquinate dehydratase-1